MGRSWPPLHDCDGLLVSYLHLRKTGGELNLVYVYYSARLGAIIIGDLFNVCCNLRRFLPAFDGQLPSPRAHK